MVDRTAKIGSPDPFRLLCAPHVALQLLGACQDPAAPVAGLQEIVLQDSGLCARLVASAARICPNRLDPVAPVSSALTGLGLPLVRSLALQAAKGLIDTPLDAAQTQYLRELWFYSQATGLLCRGLAETVDYPAPEEAHLTGLLLNLGMLALFSAHPERYPEEAGSSLSSAEVVGREQGAFGTDHRQLGAAMVESWRLDSFLPEAIRCLHLTPADCRESALVVRLARLAFEFGKTPLSLPKGAAGLAGDLLGLDSAQLTAVHREAEGRYRSFDPFDGREEECRAELERTRRRLTSLVFALADQEGIRSRLAGEADLAGIIAAARALYLHYSPAREAVFFRPDQQDRFEGLPAAGQSRLVEGLATSPDGANLLAEALRSGRLRHSFHPNAESLSAFDRQLVTLCRGSGIACLPLRSGDRTTGAVVLGLDSREGIETLGVPPLLQLGGLVARALVETPANRAASAGAGSPAQALPRKLAHELRTPLAVIGNYMSAVGLMLEGTENAEVVAAVEKEIKRIGDILAYYTDPKAARAESESPAKPPEDIVRAALESLAATLFEPRKIEVVTDFAPGIDPVPASPVVLEQILVNLLKNAAEALPEGGRVTLATREERTSRGDRQVVVSVEDNGPGIEDAIWQRLFSPVVSTKGEDHAGLGLSIVKGLADDIGAAIGCRTSPERGTRFELAIPRRKS